MIILGIETSCDETAAAIVKKNGSDIEVLSSNIATSLDMHAETGGIVPEQAAREQVKSILPVIKKTLAQSGEKEDSIDAIAVTYGPGLIGSLLVGVETAKVLSLVWDKPIVPVNHLLGHLYSCFIENVPQFPAIGLVVSGGHTDFVYMEDENSIKYIGGTRDDAAGEAFDKTARLIDLPYPGGPSISRSAQQYLDSIESANLNLFPRPMINSGNLDMSFSGLKTAVLNYTKTNQQYDKEEIAANIQEAIVDTIVEKSRLAIDNYSAKSFLLSGGVSANKILVSRMHHMCQTHTKEPRFYVPRAKTATDNAVMIAVAAAFNYRPQEWHSINANPSLSIEEI